MSDAAALAALLRAARRAVIFTGAGMSTESGIPDFRSPGGIWTKMMPVQFQDYVSDPEARRVSWQRRFEMEETWNATKPNDGHRIVAELARRGIVSHVITQNIDNLHQASGVASDHVIELHGNTTYARCIGCGQAYPLDWVKRQFDEEGAAPNCTVCDEPVKTATISFGQMMPEDEMQRATALSQACDLFIAIGSSLVVWPAAGFPMMAKRSGARLVIVNREPTEQDDIADLVIRQDIGETLGPFVGN